jgi:hypothetical protein
LDASVLIQSFQTGARRISDIYVYVHSACFNAAHRPHLIFDRCCGMNPERRPNFNFNQIVYMFCQESFLEALEVDIGTFKDDQATVAPAQLAEKRRVAPRASSARRRHGDPSPKSRRLASHSPASNTDPCCGVTTAARQWERLGAPPSGMMHVSEPPNCLA